AGLLGIGGSKGAGGEVQGRELFSVPPPPTSFPGHSQHNPAAGGDAKKQADAIKRVVEALQLNYDNLGKDSEQQKINTALRQANVDATSAAGQQITALIHQGEAYRDMLAEMNQEEKDRLDLQKQAKDLMTSLETPAEQFADQMAKL